MGFLVLMVMVFVLLIEVFVARSSYAILVSFALMCLIMGLAHDMADYGMYKDIFENGTMWFTIGDAYDYESAMVFNYGRDHGFTLLNSLIGNLGITYPEFKFLSSVFLMSILAFVTCRLVTRYDVVLLLYFFYPFFMDVIQVRNFFTEVLLFVGIYMYSRYDVEGKIGYLILVALGATFHSSAVAWIVFPIFDWLLQKKYLKFVPWFFILLGSFLPLYANSIIASMGDWALLFREDDLTTHYAIYADENDMHYGYLAVWGFVLGMVFLLRRQFECIKKMAHPFEVRFVRTIYHLFLLITCFLPMAPIVIDTLRYPRNLLIECYICLIFFCEGCLVKRKRYHMTVFVMVLVSAFAIWNFYIKEMGNVVTILTNNYLFELTDVFLP